MIAQAYVDKGKRYEWELADRHMPALASEFQPWAQSFRSRHAGKAALKELANLKSRNPSLFKDFEEEILFSCWCATKCADSPWDRPELVRERLAKDGVKALEKQRVAAGTIRQFIRDYPAFAVLGGSSKLFEALGEEWPKGLSPVEILDDHLADYKAGIAKLQELAPVFRDPGWPWVACLSYDEIVEGQRRPENPARTGLEFELALRFKMWTVTASGDDPPDVTGCAMPAKGRPHYKLIARLAKAALEGERLRTPAAVDSEASKIEGRLTKFRFTHSGTTFMGWSVAVALK